MSKDNTTLARFELAGIPPAPRGVPQIEVSFDINADGIVKVTARDLGTGKEQQVRVTAGSGLSQGDIEQIIVEAEAQKELDTQVRSIAEAKLEAESLIYTTERALEGYSDMISSEDQEIVKADVATLKVALQFDDADVIRELKARLETSAFRIAEAMYANAQPDNDE